MFPLKQTIRESSTTETKRYTTWFVSQAAKLKIIIAA